MKKDDMILISVDDHVIEPLDMPVALGPPMATQSLLEAVLNTLVLHKE